MDKLEFYQKQYAFLMGEIDRAIDALDRHDCPLARRTLTDALETAEQRWIDAVPEQAP